MGLKITVTTVRSNSNTPFWTLANNGNDDEELKANRAIFDSLVFDGAITLDFAFPDVNTQIFEIYVNDVERFREAYGDSPPMKPTDGFVEYNNANGIIATYTEEEF